MESQHPLAGIANLARAVLGILAALLLFAAGIKMRAQGSEIPSQFGLVAYGFGFVALLLAVPALTVSGQPQSVAQGHPSPATQRHMDAAD